MDGPYAVTSTLVVRPVTRRGSPWRTLRAQGSPPVIRALVVCGPHMCGPYGASPSVLARHHALPERLLPDRNISHVSAGLRGPEHWEFSLWAKNVFAEDYVSSSFHLGVFNRYIVAKGARRSWGGTVRYNF